MKKSILSMAILAIVLCGCGDHNHSHADHDNQPELEALAHTKYSQYLELFIDFNPFIVGNETNIATHLTALGTNFLPLLNGNVSVEFIIGETSIQQSSNSPISPGIYFLTLKPETVGRGKLVFTVENDQFTDQIVIEDVVVFKDAESAFESQAKANHSDDIVFLKQQAWSIDFVNTLVEKAPFSDVIETSGRILAAPGDEVTITAKASGIVSFLGKRVFVGTSLLKGSPMFTISGGNFAESNIDLRYMQAKSNYERSKAEYERSKELIKDKIISEAKYLEAKSTFDNAQIAFNTIAKNYSESGQSIVSPINGFIKTILVSDGQFVEAGTPIAVVSMNENLILEVIVSQKYFNQLPDIASANFSPLGSNHHNNSQMFKGKIISYGKSAGTESVFIPIAFEIENDGGLVPGSVAEVYLKTKNIYSALSIPVSALIEEQGNYYVFVQTGGESFQKRAIEIGASDGENVQLLAGVIEGERVVTVGAYEIKLASASTELPAHSHEH